MFKDCLSKAKIIVTQEHQSLVNNLLHENESGDLHNICLNLIKDNPAQVARDTVSSLQRKITSNIYKDHAPAIKDLWLEIPGYNLSLTLMEQTKWRRPFRFYSKDHMNYVVADAAFLVSKIMENEKKILLLVITNADYMDALSVKFLSTLLSFANCKVVMVFSDKERAKKVFVYFRRHDLEVDLIYDAERDHYCPAQPVTSDPIEFDLASLSGTKRRLFPYIISYYRKKSNNEKLLEILTEAASAYVNGGYYKIADDYSQEGILLANQLNKGNSAEMYSLLHSKYICAVTHYKADEAIEIANKQLEIAFHLNDEIKIANAKYNLAMIYLRINKSPEKALSYLEDIPLSIRRNGGSKSVLTYAFCLNARAFAWYQLGNAYKAKQYLIKAINILNPFNENKRVKIEQATFMYNYSHLEFYQEKYEEALNWIKKAQQLENDFFIYKVEEGNYLCALARYSEAKDSYTKAKKMGAPSPELLIALANAEYMSRNIERSLETLRELRIKFPEYIEGFVDAAMILVEHMKDLKQAKILIEKGLRWHANNGLIWFQLGRINHELGDLQKAKRNYQKAIELNNNLKETWNNLAAVHYEEGNLEKALLSLEKALLIDPHDQTALENKEFLKQQIQAG